MSEETKSKTSSQGYYTAVSAEDGDIIEIDFSNMRIDWLGMGLSWLLDLPAGTTVTPKVTFDPDRSDDSYKDHSAGSQAGAKEKGFLENSPVNGVRFEFTGGGGDIEFISQAPLVWWDRSEVPAFASASQALAYVVGDAVERLALPLATGGNGELMYTFDNLPLGIHRVQSYDTVASGYLEGNPTTVMAATAYVYSATDQAGSVATHTLNITVT